MERASLLFKTMRQLACLFVFAFFFSWWAWHDRWHLKGCRIECRLELLVVGCVCFSCQFVKYFWFSQAVEDADLAAAVAEVAVEVAVDSAEDVVAVVAAAVVVVAQAVAPRLTIEISCRISSSTKTRKPILLKEKRQ